MKLLPNDHAVFVIREVTTPNARNARPGYLFETFHALQCGTEKIAQELGEGDHLDQYRALLDTEGVTDES